MSALGQIVAVTVQNLKSLPQRRGNAGVAIIGVAGVVVVFVAVLALAAGFRQTMQSSASERNVIVLRDGSSSEMDSGLSNEQVRIIEEAPGLARTAEGVISSAEVYVIVDLPKRSTGTDANVPLRGVDLMATRVREQFRIVEGRLFEPGQRELIAGRGAASQFAGLDVGSRLQFGQSEWTVVGHFEAMGGVAESELWADVRVVQPVYRRNGYSSVLARLEAPDRLPEMRDHLSRDPRLSVEVKSEAGYYAEQSGALSGFISVVGYGIALLMAFGAAFGAINTMYTSVSERGREIATLKALGFGSTGIVVSVMVESVLLALVGGLLGGALAYLLVNGLTVSTLNFSGFSQVVFSFRVTGALLIQGVVIAVVIGTVAGLFPALRAARRPVSLSLRDL